MLGMARIAREKFIPALHVTEDGELLAVASSSQQGQAQARQLGSKRVYSSYEELLQDPEIDAVYIPLPNALHKEWVIRAAAAKKHILCEKPLALTAADAEEMVSVCKRNGVFLAEAFMYRYHPQLQRVKMLLAQGVIGEVKYFRAGFSYLMNWEKKNIRLDPQLGGGCLFDIGCYCLDALNFLLGMKPEEIYATGVFHPEYKIDIAAAVNLKLEKGILAQLQFSFQQPFSDYCEIFGERGTITLPRAFRPDKAGGQGIILFTDAGGKQQEEVYQGDPYLLQLQVYHANLRTEDNDGAAMSRLIEQARLLEACFASLQQEQVVHL
nr:Gfo/Idh/MocA family oxidoreductase [Carboxydocella sporoproducens]